MKLSKTNRVLLLIAALLFSASAYLIGSEVYAKYVTQATLEGSLVVKADIGTITLQEHRAVKQESGLYVLSGVGSDKKCDGTDHEHITAGLNQNNGNTYQLIPGLDIPKDPHIVIEKDNDMPVYVFVEVCDELENSSVRYKVDDTNWLPLMKNGSSVPGVHGGKVYVYTKNKSTAAVVTNTATDLINPVYILENNTVEVMQGLLSGNQTELKLTFYASMYQVKKDASAADIYNNSTDY